MDADESIGIGAYVEALTASQVMLQQVRAERDEARRVAREMADALRLLAPWQSRHYRDRFDALPWAKEES